MFMIRSVPSIAVRNFRGFSSSSAYYSSGITMVKTKFDNVVKSVEDKRNYRGLVLDNDLKVLLISDPTTDKSAAALSVNIGYLSDPWELPGLAHFLEHMLFLGTEKYPSENEYSKYLSEHSGASNAFTSSENTTFYFDVAPEHLHGALDRFAQFFVAPLFTESATDREVCAVNSEHEKNVPSDSWRLHQLEQSLSKPGHPYSKFGTGNKKTLDEDPKAKGINVRDELLKFHSTWYSSNIMSLAILGKESLDEMQEVTENLFGAIVNKKVDVPEWPGNPFGAEQLAQRGMAVPIKDWRSLTITFPIPDTRKHYKSAPGRYLSHLLGHEGKGSLLSALKRRGWSSHLDAGARRVANDITFFVVSVDLTEEGLQHTDDIVDLIFQYITMLRKEGPKEWIFQEYCELAKMHFRFKDREIPRSYVVNIVDDLMEFPMEEVLAANYLVSEWKPELITNILNKLTPSNCRVGIVSKKFEAIADQTEKWYGTQYKVEKIPQEVLKKWEESVPSNELQLPGKNEFIPSNLELFPKDESTSSHPAIVHESALARAWFKQDDEFLLPKANLIFELTSPLAFLDPVKVNLMNLYVTLVRDVLTEYTYDADLASLKWDIVCSKYGLIMTIKGFNDKQHILMEKVLDTLINLKVDPKRFEIFRESFVRGLNNFSAEQPHTHAMHYESACLVEKSWINSDLLNASKSLTVENLEAFIPQLLSMLHIECLIHGNSDKESALNLVNLVEKKLAGITQPLLPPHLLRFRDLRLEDGCNFVYEVTNETHKSSCAELYLQCPPQSTQHNMLLELFVQITSEPCFNILRTKEQLGYIVSMSIGRSQSSQGLRVLVQSHKHPVYVDQSIERFLHGMKSYISEMKDDEFDRHKQALAARRLEKPKKLASRTYRFWSEIANQQYNFERDHLEVSFLNTISKEDLQKFYQDYLCVEAPHRHKFAVHVISTAEGGAGADSNEISDLESLPETPKVEKIQDISTFKSGLGCFPFVQPLNGHRPKGARAKL